MNGQARHPGARRPATGFAIVDGEEIVVVAADGSITHLDAGAFSGGM
jgi:hypothetical protein